MSALKNKVYNIYYPFTLGKPAIAPAQNCSSVRFWGHDILRSPSVSVGEAALKGLGESLSPVEKTVAQPELNLYPLQGKVFFST
jgi:hypothetical protein